MSIIYERISIVVSLSLIGLAIYSVLTFPVDTAEIILFNTPLGLDSPQQWLMVLLLGALVIAGTDTTIRAHPQLASQRLGYVFTFCTLPTLLMLLATQLLPLAPNALSWAISLILVGLLLWFTIITEFHQVPLEQNYAYQWYRPWQQFIGYSLILIFYILIYQTRIRSALSASSVAMISMMVTVTLVRQPPIQIGKTWLYAGIIGLSLGQITWVLNYWRATALEAGLFLFLVYYVLLGLAQQQLLGQLSRRLLWEFVAIVMVVLFLIFRL
ncbi:hypothetical protein QUF64_03340 [Anaerolineales bacterium HSG6]|nr:hypothetical protein [Anaerolineales bacterium HSG6]MDM8531593.1 hypothetical protein [Anaerolineales bacterium HSG25]